MGHDKPNSIAGLEFLINRGIDVVTTVGPSLDAPSLWKRRILDIANQYGIPTSTDSELYQYIQEGENPKQRFSLKNIDLVISLSFWKRIKKPLIDLPKIGCINFHPYPLPEFRGVGGYNVAILENTAKWGVSAHFVDENFDTGDIIMVKRFDINPEEETAFSLEKKSQNASVELFKDVIEIAIRSNSLPRIPQGNGRYFSKNDFFKLQKIKPDDSLDEIERKIRAFWYPPYSGAIMEIQGKEFTVINEKILKDIASKYHDS